MPIMYTADDDDDRNNGFNTAMIMPFKCYRKHAMRVLREQIQPLCQKRAKTYFRQEVEIRREQIQPLCQERAKTYFRQKGYT